MAPRTTTTKTTSPEPADPPLAPGVRAPIKGVTVEPLVLVDDLPQPEPPMPTTVVAAIARVMAEIGGIRKMGKNERIQRGLIEASNEKGVPYAYRGIDQLASAAQPLFGKYGVVIIPTVLSQEIVQVVVNNNPWTDTFVEVRWDLYGPGWANASLHSDMITSVTTGVGRDNSDKGVNKAMTIAFKNLLLRILCIGDPQDDADMERHETGRDEDRREAADDAPKNPADVVFESVRDGSPAVKAAVKALAEEQGKVASARAMYADKEWMEMVAERVAATKIAEQQDAVAEAFAADHTVETPEMERAMTKTLPHHEGGGDLPPGEMVCLECGEVRFADAMEYEDHVAAHGTSTLAGGEKP